MIRRKDSTGLAALTAGARNDEEIRDRKIA